MHETARQGRSALVYGRQSQKNEASIGEQLQIGRQRCQDEGWPVAGELSDGESASRHAARKRADWPKLLAAVEHADNDLIIWLWESSRGDRTLSTWAALLESCQRHGVLICVESHDGRLYDMNVPRDWKTMAEDGVDSHYESEKTSLRVRRDAARDARNGKPHGRILYGYRREYAWEIRRTRRVWAMQAQAEDPAEAPVVREIIGKVAAGHSLRAITAALDARGIRTRSGATWTPNRVRDVAMNTAYIGKRVHDAARRSGRAGADAAVYDAAWPKLVDESTFYAARAVLADPRRTTTRPGGARHLLSLIAECGVCHGLLTVGYPKRTGRRPVYHCRDRNCVWIDEASLDEHVTAEVLALVSKDTTWKKLNAAGPTGDAELKKARGHAAEVEADYNQTVELFRTRKISPGAFAEVEPGKLADLAAARAKVTELETPPALLFLAGADDVTIRWTRAPLSARREAIRTLARIEVHRSPSPGHRVEAARRVTVTPR